MARSMTGYGSARATGSRLEVEAEVRSVNGRSLKLSLRLPSLLADREPDVEALVRRQVRRGSVTLHLRTHLLRPQDAVRIRPEIVEGYLHALEPLRDRGLVEGRLSPEAILALPGAVELGPAEDLRPADWRVARKAVEEALAALDAMRQREAAHLVRELRTIVRRARRTLTSVRRRAPKVVEEHRARLRERLRTLLAPDGVEVDENVLAREVAVVADRCDVTEETTRLASHLDAFEGHLACEEVGRTLDFLAQEMLREANTIGAKSSDVAIARAVIALKSDIDRLKEQVANLE